MKNIIILVIDTSVQGLKINTESTEYFYVNKNPLYGTIIINMSLHICLILQNEQQQK